MVEVLDYLQLIIPEHQQPRFLAQVAASLQPVVDAINLALQLQLKFDLDTAVGDQLDKVGERIGLTRYVTEPLAPQWFSWGVPSLGWGQANWYKPIPFAPPSAAVVKLDDYHYRILLKARVLANNWDGTIEGAYASWAVLFANTGLQILIQNVYSKTNTWVQTPAASPGIWGVGLWGVMKWGLGLPPPRMVADGMHIVFALVGPNIDPLTEALFTGGLLNFKPAGVKIDAYAVSSGPGKPLFAWGVGPATPGNYTAPPTNLAGWGIGYWPKLTIPAG